LAVASYFLESNSEVLIEKTKQDSQVYRSSYKEKNLVNYPLVVLVDDSSASASEILAGSLRDDRKVPVVGQKTYGKGVVQRIYNLDDGNEVKLTVAEWLTPKGSSINKTGLDPDIKVDPAKDSLEVGLKSF
jgi:carboxyl-terminal processing protease